MIPPTAPAPDPTGPPQDDISRRVAIPILLALLLAVTGCGGGADNEEGGDAGGLSPTLQETMTIGADTSLPLDALLSMPRFVTAGSDHVYVADRKEQRVKVYDLNGRFERVIGSKGRGPGEFERILAMAIDRDGTLLVFDGNNGRVTRFSPEGELLASHTTTQMPRLLVPLEDRYLFAYGSRDADSLFHVVDSTFSSTGQTFGAISRFGDTDDRFWRLTLNFDPGRVAFASDGQSFLYTPDLYDGTLYRYALRDGHWQPDRSIEGYVGYDKPYELLDGDGPKDAMVRRIFTQSRKFTALVRGSSQGLYRLQDGRFVHFTRRMQGEAHPLYLEVFDEDGQLEGHGPVAWADSTSKPSLNALRLQVKAKDAEDRFYLLDITGDWPILRVATLSLNE